MSYLSINPLKNVIQLSIIRRGSRDVIQEQRRVYYDNAQIEAYHLFIL